MGGVLIWAALDMRDGCVQRGLADHCLHVGAALPGKKRAEILHAAALGVLPLFSTCPEERCALDGQMRWQRCIVKATILSECAQPVWGV